MGGITTLDGLANGAAVASGAGTGEELPFTGGVRLQASLAGNRPSSSRVPEVVVTQLDDRWLSAEVLATIRSNRPSVLSSRVLMGSGNADWRTASRVFCCSAQPRNAGRLPD